MLLDLYPYLCMAIPCPPCLWTSSVSSTGHLLTQVGPRQVCAQLLTGSGPCTWDLESLIPEEDGFEPKETGKKGSFCGLLNWLGWPRRWSPAGSDFDIILSIIMIYNWLVVWNMICFSHNILGRNIPTDFHIFQRGRHTTNQFVVYSSLLYFLLVIHGSCARMKTRGLAVEPIDYEDYGDVWNPLRGGRFGYVLFYEAH